MGNDNHRYSGEPTLNDLLDDPLTQILMRRDGVARSEIIALIERQRRAMKEAAAG